MSKLIILNERAKYKKVLVFGLSKNTIYPACYECYNPTQDRLRPLRGG